MTRALRFNVTLRLEQSLLELEPIPTLLARMRAELSADFDFAKPIRLSRAPGRLDVMGGIADYTGSLVCEMPLDRAASVAIQSRTDRQIQVFSFNLFDEHKPFTLRMPLDALAEASTEKLRQGFDEPGRKWGAYLVGTLFILHERGLIDLRDPRHRGFNLALLSTVPQGGGISSSAAIEVATILNVMDHFEVPRTDPMQVATLCQAVENRVAGAPCGIMDQVASCIGEPGTLMRMICQPHEVLPLLPLPRGVRIIGINSGVRHSVGGGQYARTRCAASMGHRMILERMREMGRAGGHVLTGDPMRGYLANLDPDDYKRFFRPVIAQWMNGKVFLDRYGPADDPVAPVDPAVDYPIQHATDHHILEARRVRRFVEFLESAASEPIDATKRTGSLDRAGHLMYASHLSYTMDAMLGAPECDMLVDLVRKHEPGGLYGARITGGGCGGTVAVLCNESERADQAVDEIREAYEKASGLKAELFTGSSPGAWHSGTRTI